MSGGILTRIRYFTLFNVRKLNTAQLETGACSWKDLANLSYGQKTMEHRGKLKNAFIDLRRVLEKYDDMKLIEIGSYSVGASTPSSDLDVLLIPYANDPTEDRIEQFNRKMEDHEFRRRKMQPLALQLNSKGILKGKANVYYNASVPIIKGTTRTGVSFDVQIGSIETIYSSNFVRLAFQLDPRQILVYHWLRGHIERYGYFGGKENLFTAFHLYMLIIHFAQATGILPILMDRYPIHLSRACHWRDLTEEFRSGKSTVAPLYSTEDADRWAPVIVDQLVDYYSSVDFTKVEIDVGRAKLNERATNSLLLIEPFHDQKLGVCRVTNGASIMKLAFTKLQKIRSG